MARKKNKAVYKCASPGFLVDGRYGEGDVVRAPESLVPSLLGKRTNSRRYSLPSSFFTDVEVVLPRELT